MDILDLIASDNYIPYNRTLAKTIGVENAIIFGALCGYQRHFKQHEFYREQQNIMEDTCLTEYTVRKSIKELKELGLIFVVKKGLPAKYYYKINTTRFIEMTTTSGAENDTTGDCENDTTINNNIINKKNNNIDSAVTEIFDYWNSKNIIKHSQLTDDRIKTIQRCLKENSIDVIKECIDRYNTVITDVEYYFDTKWTLVEFLKQKNAMNDFKDDGSKWINYKNRKIGNNINYEQRTYTNEQINGLFVNLDNINI